MNILVVCQYYHPEPFRITDICEELVKRGHDVSVITGEPNYPEGEIYPEYKKHDRTNETINGVHVHRCRIIPRKTGVLFRFLNYYSFVVSSVLYILLDKIQSSGERKFDVVFVNQLSPVMMAYAGILYKYLYRVPMVLYCLDLWPESLIAGGIERDSLVYKVFHRISKEIYKKADKICVTSNDFSKYFENQFGLFNLEYLPQYAEDIFEESEIDTYHNVLNLTFAGNIGAMQSVDTIIKAASLLKKERVHFHIVGGGSELKSMQDLAKKLTLSNVTFYGRRPVEEMPLFFSKSDAMLITMKADPGISMTLPGKVQSYMAAGKPIIGAINGETDFIIKKAKCGFCGEAENYYDLTNNILAFMNCNNKDQLSKNARNYYENNFDKSIFIDNLTKCLNEIIN